MKRGKALSAAELRHLDVVEMTALHDLAAGRATRQHLVDLRDLLAIGIKLGRSGIGPELLPVAVELMQDLRQALASPAPITAAMGLQGRLAGMQEVLAEQRRMVSRAEWVRVMRDVRATR